MEDYTKSFPLRVQEVLAKRNKIKKPEGAEFLKSALEKAGFTSVNPEKCRIVDISCPLIDENKHFVIQWAYGSGVDEVIVQLDPETLLSRVRGTTEGCFWTDWEK